MGRYLDGRVTAVVGTHTHVQTSDETVLPGGTAYITDLGMTGPTGGAIGRDLQSVTAAFVTGRPTTFELAHGEPVVEGVIVDVDYRTGRAVGIERVRER
jgi:calcineurin-like phosphoesterase